MILHTDDTNFKKLISTDFYGIVITQIDVMES